MKGQREKRKVTAKTKLETLGFTLTFHLFSFPLLSKLHAASPRILAQCPRLQS